MKKFLCIFLIISLLSVALFSCADPELGGDNNDDTSKATQAADDATDTKKSESETKKDNEIEADKTTDGDNSDDEDADSEKNTDKNDGTEKSESNETTAVNTEKETSSKPSGGSHNDGWTANY